MPTVYIDQEQDDEEQYLQSWVVYLEGDTEAFDDYREAQEYAEELANDNDCIVVDGGEF